MKNKAEAVKTIFYWKREDGAWAMQITHNTCYSELEAATSKEAVLKLAAKMGYEAVEDDGE